MTIPKVSIGVPVYNGEKYLREALDSLLCQEYDDFEIIVSDNASSDSTAGICREYAARDRRIHYHRNESNIGSAPNYRRVFDLARGEFFKWLAYDDRVHPRFIRRCLEEFESAPSSVVLVYPQCELIDERGEVLGQAEDHVDTRHRRSWRRLAHVLRHVSYAYPVGGLIRSECLRRTQLEGTTAYWDMVLLVELSLYGEIREIPEVLSQQREHTGNAVTLCSAEQGGEVATNPSKADKRTREKLLAWTNPTQAGRKIWLPIHEERYWEFLKRVHHAPLSPWEKTLCYVTVPVVGYWCRFRKLAGKWKRRVLTQPAALTVRKAKS